MKKKGLLIYLNIGLTQFRLY